MANNGKGRKNNKPDPQAPGAQPEPQPEAQQEAQPQAGFPAAPQEAGQDAGPQEAQPKAEPSQPAEIKAEFIGTVQPKYKTEIEDVGQKIIEKVEGTVGGEAEMVYRLAKRHKIAMAGLAAALAVSVIVAMLLNVNLQAKSDRVVALSDSYNSISVQNSQLSSQLSNLSDYETNFSKLRDQLSSTQFALTNKNITIQGLHSNIAFLNTELSNSSTMAQNLNSTIFDLQQQVHNLTRHLNMDYVSTLVAAGTNNLQLGSGQTYTIKFAVSSPGVVVVNITDPYPYKVIMNNNEGSYFVVSYPGNAYPWNVTIPVYGSPSNGQAYTLYVTNLASQAIYGSIGVTERN